MQANLPVADIKEVANVRLEVASKDYSAKQVMTFTYTDNRILEVDLGVIGGKVYFKEVTFYWKDGSQMGSKELALLGKDYFKAIQEVYDTASYNNYSTGTHFFGEMY